MTAYIIRRLLYAVLILIDVLPHPDSPTSASVRPAAIAKWKAERGYDKPLLYNGAREGGARLTDTIYFEKSAAMFAFEFGRADDGRDIAYEIRSRAGPSLAVALPVFIVGLGVNISFALLLALFRATRFDVASQVFLVAMMSISSLFFIIAGQYVFSKLWHLMPISGYAAGFDGFRFLVLPAVIGVFGSLGGATRLYRTIFIEEIGRDYVRTARAKGMSELTVLFRHVLGNGMIPILTGVVVVIPSLFIGSLVTESFFGIPGLGSYTIEAIQAQDFGVVRSMVFIGSLLYIIGLVLTDISYTLVDPRVRLDG